MPAYADKLSDQEIADVTNYIRNSWGNSASAVTRRRWRRRDATDLKQVTLPRYLPSALNTNFGISHL